jgi:putative DNA primase/helicase
MAHNQGQDNGQPRSNGASAPLLTTLSRGQPTGEITEQADNLLNVRDADSPVPSRAERDEALFRAFMVGHEPEATVVSAGLPRGNYQVQPIAVEVHELGLNDSGNGKRFADHHAAYVAHVKGWGWIQEHRGKWLKQDSAEMEGLAKKTVRDMLLARANALQGVSKLDEGLWAQFGRFAHQSASMKQVRAMLQSARSEEAVQMQRDQFDADPDLLNTPNGILDLRTAQLRPHTANDYHTRQTTVPYVPLAPATRWEQFIEEITNGDQELALYLQMAAGYSITGHTKEQCLFFLLGGGSNGKSVFLNAIQHAVGNYAESVSSGFFLDDRSVNQRAELARLQGARLVTSSELGERKSFDGEFLKEVTGEDRLNPRQLYGESFSYKPLFKFWVFGNSTPNSKDVSHGFWRRFRFLPFNGDFKDARADLDLNADLRSEAVGILSWLVQGARLWYEAKRLFTPKAVLDLWTEVRDDHDPMRQFITERCDTGGTLSDHASDLLRAHDNWSAENGLRNITAKRLGQELMRLGYTKRKDSNGNSVWQGVALKP